MKLNFKYFYYLLIFINLGLMPFLSQAFSLQKDGGLDQTAIGSGIETTGATTDINLRIGGIINVVLSFLGVIFLILMIYGGFKWMLARGNSKEAEVALDLIKDAIIGVAIVSTAYVITAFVGAAMK